MAGKLDAINAMIPASRIRNGVQRALGEDGAFDDITAKACVDAKQAATARIISKSKGVLCGLLEAKLAFSGLRVAALAGEGDELRKGQTVLKVMGNARKILAAERTALDYLSVLSGISTEARKFGARAAATRKTHPGMGASEKRSVRVGGGMTHRPDLSAAYLVKDNHVSLIAAELGCGRPEAIITAVKRARAHERGANKMIEVEAETAEEAEAAASAGVDAVLLDNFSLQGARGAAARARKANPKIIVECSGGITRKNARKFLEFCDFVSSSELTLKARPLDFSLEIVKQ